MHPGRRRERQDPGDLAARGVRAGDGCRPAARRARGHVHGQGGDGDGRPAGGARPSRRGGLHVPRRGTPSAAAFLAAGPRIGSAGDPRLQGAHPGAAREGPAGRLPLSRRARPRRRDRMGQGAPDRGVRVRDAGPRRGSRRATPGRPHGRALPALRDGQGTRRPDRLRGHAGADDRAHRGRRGDRGRGARPVSLVLGRRVPGHEPAPGGAPRDVAGRARGHRGRR